MKALLVADNAGRGHIVRCAALARELERRGWEAQIIGPNQESVIVGYDLVVADVRAPQMMLFGEAKVVRIVDHPGDLPSADLVICGGAGASVVHFPHVPNIRAGAHYSLLRPEFARERGRKRGREGVLDLRVIVGWDAAELAAEMAGAALAITYGGMRAMECACVGTPMIVLPRNDGEQLNADGLLTAGAAVIAADYQVQVMADTMIGCPDLLNTMSKNAFDLVDGHGCRRVGQAIEDLFR